MPNLIHYLDTTSIAWYSININDKEEDFLHYIDIYVLVRSIVEVINYEVPKIKELTKYLNDYIYIYVVN